MDLRLTRYKGGEKGPVVLAHGMGANPLTFSLDTINPNLVEFLVKREYDVWLEEWRGSTLLPSAETMSFDCDDVALYDHPTIEQKIKEITGNLSLHWITHCVGSITLLMSVLREYVKPASLVCSSGGMFPVASPIIRFKTHLRLAEALRMLGVKGVTTDSFDDESFWQRVFEKLVRVNWIPATSGVTRRCVTGWPSSTAWPPTTLRSTRSPTWPCTSSSAPPT